MESVRFIVNLLEVISKGTDAIFNWNMSWDKNCTTFNRILGMALNDVVCDLSLFSRFFCTYSHVLANGLAVA